MILVIFSIEKKQIKSASCAASMYNVPRSTLRDRRAGKPLRRDCQPNPKNLTELEEEVIVSYILDLYQRGLAPTYAAVCDMVDKLLAARGGGQVGIHWPRNFVERTDSLTTHFNRAGPCSSPTRRCSVKTGCVAPYAYTSRSARGPLGSSYAEQPT